MSWRNLIWMTIILCLAALAFCLSRRKPPAPIPPTDPALEELAGAVKAYKLIRARSYRELTPDAAVRGAIEGMVRQVGRFSVYVPPGKVDPLRRRVAGELEETGLRIAAQGGRLVVVGPLADSPAHKAGLFGGLEILAVDGVDADELTIEEARKKVATPADGTVRLRLRDAEGIESVKQLKTSRFDAETVTGLLRDDSGQWAYALDEKKRIFYLRIGEFVDRTPTQLQTAYRNLDDPRALVLDVRDNPGGVMVAAAEVADRFLAEGLIVRTVPRNRKPQLRYAHADGTYPAVPLVVLIDEGTASAAEIVAGALQVHGRAVLLGRRSCGKWWVHSLFSLGGGLGKIYVPTAEYFLAEAEPATLPSQPTTSEAPDEEKVRPGLRPDVKVRIPPASAERLELLRLRAMVVQPPQRSRPSATARTRPARSPRLKRSILELDAQLARALQLLRQQRVPTTRPAGTSERPLVRP